MTNFGSVAKILALKYIHEAHGGHTIEKHVGKDLNYLRGRNINIATSYPDLKTANYATTTVIRRNILKIKHWYDNAPIGREKNFKKTLGEKIGYGVRSGDNTLRSATRALVRLKKLEDNTIRIVTSYPIGEEEYYAKNF